MEHHEQKQQSSFTIAGAALGLISYVILVILVIVIFMAR